MLIRLGRRAPAAATREPPVAPPSSAARASVRGGRAQYVTGGRVLPSPGAERLPLRRRLRARRRDLLDEVLGLAFKAGTEEAPMLPFWVAYHVSSAGPRST